MTILRSLNPFPRSQARTRTVELFARPPRALPAAHFERSDITIICETVHQLS
jgi:hypothetical protein